MYHPWSVLAVCLLCVMGAWLIEAMVVKADDVTIPELAQREVKVVSNTILSRKKRETSADGELSSEDMAKYQLRALVRYCRFMAVWAHLEPGLENEDFVTFMSRCCCVDVNECLTNNGGCSQICRNTFMSHHCQCEPKYALQPDGKTCIQIDNCSVNNGGCEQICTSTTDSRVCSCRTGFTLNSDSTSCDDINECANDNGRCAYKCTNVPGSRSCSCRNELFVLGSNGYSCKAVCPPTFVQTSGSCYKVFSADNEARSAADAAVKCTQEHARAKLVAIGSGDFKQSIISNLLWNEDKLLGSWKKGWWTSGIYRPSQQLFQWGTGEYIDDDNEFWGLKKMPYEGTCVWILQLEVHNHMWGNYDCDTPSGFVCEIVLE